jgi:hypothetical protein
LFWIEKPEEGGKIMPTDSTAIRIYMHNKVFIGTINSLAPEGRLLDVLCGTNLNWSEEWGGFLELSDVVVQQGNGSMKKAPFTYIRKSSIHLAATLSADLYRGLGSRIGPKSYPFIEKSPFPVALETSDYEVKGNIYLTASQLSWEVLKDEPIFLPLTNAEICNLASGAHWKVPFVAVNKEQIISVTNEPALSTYQSRLKYYELIN